MSGAEAEAAVGAEAAWETEGRRGRRRRLTCRIFVSDERLYGTKSWPFESACTTSPRQRSERLIWIPSRSDWPLVPARFVRSEPARSTNRSFGRSVAPSAAPGVGSGIASSRDTIAWDLCAREGQGRRRRIARRELRAEQNCAGGGGGEKNCAHRDECAFIFVAPVARLAAPRAIAAITSSSEETRTRSAVGSEYPVAVEPLIGSVARSPSFEQLRRSWTSSQ